MSIRTNLSVVVAVALAFGIGWTACTSETEQGGGNKPTPGGGDDTERREVLLTLNNKLALQAGTKAADTKAIATVAENAISTLDVYVFGCDTEGGEYTFQERFAYRAGDNDKLPAGASELQLAVQGTDDATTTGLLSLKRGLFVKLYCIANDTLLVDPAAGGVTPVEATAFVPLTLSDPAEGSVKVLKAGTPLESSFTSYHTHLLTAATKGDTLACPLAMSGALTTALDLTSFDNSARLQAGFRLTRLAARFDIQNVAKDSRFTLQSVSMGSGRRGSGYFPIRVYGDLPTAKPAELITYPVRAFYGTGANNGLCAGAFYSYPSPEADKGYLILKGLYKVNETESKEVSYQIPFRQRSANGQELFLDINHNHRYTIAITAADAYHLDASITVADWADDGSIEYIPENKPGEIIITIPPGYADETEENKDTKTVIMSVKTGSTFEMAISTNSALKVNKTYAGGAAGQLQNWLTVSEPAITPGTTLSTYRYTVSLTTPYLLGRYPRATLRLVSTIDGSESLLFVEPVAAPLPIETPQPPKAPNGSSDNPNSFDEMNNTASLYRITGSQTQVKINCLNGVELESKPDWLDVNIPAQVGAATTATLTLNNRDAVVADNKGIITFRNKKKADLKIDVTVSLLDAPIVPSYDGIGADNGVTPENGTTPADVQMKITPSNKVTVKATSMDGVSVKIAYPEGSPEWLSFSGAAATKAAVAPAKELAATTTATPVAAKAPAAASPLSGFAVTSLPGSPSDPANYVTKATVMQKVEDIVFSPIADKLAGAQQATVTLTNIIGGKEKRLTITPEMQSGSAVESTTTPSVPLQSVLKGKAITLYQLPGSFAATSQMTIDVTSLGGSKLAYTASEGGTGLTLSPAEHTANTATYVLSPALIDGTNKATGTLSVKNYTNPDKAEDYAVTVLRSDLTGGDKISLSAVKDQSATVKISSHEGFTIDETKIDWDGGTQWFKVSTLDFAAGADKVVTVVANSATTKVHPAVLTLTNKIVNGGDLKVTVTPKYVAPTVVYAGNNSPIQNTMPDNTANLYNVSGSRLDVTVTSVGGSCVYSQTGVNVTGGDNTNTTNTYTLTWNSSAAPGNYSVVFGNKSNPDAPRTTLNVNVLSNAITVDDNTNVNAANSGTNSISVTSPAGCTASIPSGWNGGGQWFDITTHPGAGTQNLVITQRNNVNTVMKPVTVRLTSAMVGGTDVHKDITITPTNFQKPTLSATSGSVGVATLNTSATSASFTMTAPAGGVAPQSSNTGIATISVSGTTVTITSVSTGTTTIIVPNASNTGVSETYTVTVKSTTYNGAKVWYYNGYFIAASDAGTTTWTANLTRDYCANKAPNGTWKVPSDAEWRVIIGGTSGTSNAPDALYQEMKSKSVFAATTRYWSSTANGSDRAYNLYFDSSSAYVGSGSLQSGSFQVRCVSQ